MASEHPVGGEVDDTKEPRVWNIRDSNKPSDALYIGRAGKNMPGKWGNPFSLVRPLTRQDVDKITERMPLLAELEYVWAGNTVSRSQSIDLYHGYLVWAVQRGKLDVRELVRETEKGLQARDEACFCAPQPCHGDWLIKLASSYAFYRRERGESHEQAVNSALYIVKGTVT